MTIYSPMVVDCNTLFSYRALVTSGTAKVADRVGEMA